MRCEVITCCHPHRVVGEYDSSGLRCESSTAVLRGDGRARCWVHEQAYRAGRVLAYVEQGAELAAFFGPPREAPVVRTVVARIGKR